MSSFLIEIFRLKKFCAIFNFKKMKENIKSKNGHLRRFYIHTFGCQMNENDSERIAGLLINAGLENCSSIDESDLIIVNSCAVRKKSEEKLFSLLGRLSALKKKKKIILGVIGCVAQLYRQRLFTENRGIDFIAGPDNYSNLLDIISNSHEGKNSLTQRRREWQEICPTTTLRKNKLSSYVTIMEGCNNFCSYCVVPFARGREKSRPMNFILNEIRELSKQGYKEIQLLGQNVNSYRDPETGADFVDLLEKVNDIPGIRWIRFITSHPKNFTARIAKAMYSLDKVCCQLHLPAQSGSSKILKMMNRGYSRDDYLEIIQNLKQLMPDISLSTDIIVGYPGESDEDFKDTLSLVKTVRFTNIFSFCYSPRPGTKAARLKDDVPLKVKKKRLIELQSIQKNIQLEDNKVLIGKTMEVMLTGTSKKDNQVFCGRNEAFQVVNFCSAKEVINPFIQVKISDCGPYSLKGTVLP